MALKNEKIQAKNVDVKKPKAKKPMSQQKKIRSQIDEGLKILREMNADLVEVNLSVKQEQTKLNQLKETNGKRKKQKMETAQNNLKNLNKRQTQLEKEAKTMLNNLRGLNVDVNLAEECKDMAAIKSLLVPAPKKKKSEEVKEQQSEQSVEREQCVKSIDPDPPKSQSRLYSLFGDVPVFSTTFAKPPHFSEFNSNLPQMLNNKHDQVRIYIRRNFTSSVFDLIFCLDYAIVAD